MNKITAWINKNNSFIAWAGLIVLPASAWWLNTKWPNAENVIAISAALIGIAPAIYIEFSRRANSQKEKLERKTNATDLVLNGFRLLRAILNTQEESLKGFSLLCKEIIETNVRIKLDESFEYLITEVKESDDISYKLILENIGNLDMSINRTKLTTFIYYFNVFQTNVERLGNGLEKKMTAKKGGYEAEIYNDIQIFLINHSHVFETAAECESMLNAYLKEYKE